MDLSSGEDFIKIITRRTPRNKDSYSHSSDADPDNMNTHDAAHRKEDTNSLSEFTVRATQPDWGGTTKITVYPDSLKIKRISCGYQIVGPTQDTILFDEIESVTATSASHHIWGEMPGRIQILCRKDTRYWKITEEVLDTEKRNYNRVFANEIVYDSKYNKLVGENISIISDAIRDYRSGKRKETGKQPSQTFYFRDVNTTGGQVIIGSGDNNAVDIGTIGSVEVNNIRQKILERVDNSNDREEMLRILKEICDTLDDIKAGKPVEENKGLMDRIKKHIKENSWFYSDILMLVGTAVFKRMGLA